MAAALQRAAAAAAQQDGQVIVVVPVAVGVTAAIGDHRVVQQCAFTLAHAVELLQQVGELPGVEDVPTPLESLFKLSRGPQRPYIKRI